MKKTIFSKRAQTSLTLIGILGVILVVNSVILYFYGHIGAVINTNTYGIGANGFNQNEYNKCVEKLEDKSGLFGGDILLNEDKLTQTDITGICNENATENKFLVNVITTIGEFPILSGIWVVINVIFVIGSIILFLHGSS